MYIKSFVHHPQIFQHITNNGSLLHGKDDHARAHIHHTRHILRLTKGGQVRACVRQRFTPPRPVCLYNSLLTLCRRIRTKKCHPVVCCLLDPSTYTYLLQKSRNFTVYKSCFLFLVPHALLSSSSFPRTSTCRRTLSISFRGFAILLPPPLVHRAYTY